VLAALNFAIPLVDAGIPYAQPLCSLLTPSELDGGWCVDGDNVVTGASWADSTHSMLQTPQVCPNGPDCAVEHMQLYMAPSTPNSFPAAVSGLAADSTTCALLRSDYNKFRVAVSWYGMPPVGIAPVDGGVGDGFRLSNTNVACFYAAQGCGGASVSACVNDVAAAGNYNLYCATITGGALLSLYVNGTLAATQALSSPPCTAELRQWDFGNYNAVQMPYSFMLPFSGAQVAAYYTPQALSASRIASLSHATLADNPAMFGADGGLFPLIATRADGPTAVLPAPFQSHFCESSTGYGSMLPTGRPCIAKGGLWSSALRTVVNQGFNRTLTLDNMPSSAAVGGGGAPAPVLITSTAPAPDGTRSAAAYKFAAVSGDYGQYSLVYDPYLLGYNGAICANKWCVISLRVQGIPGLTDVGHLRVLGNSALGTSYGECPFTSAAPSLCHVTVYGTTEATFGHDRLQAPDEYAVVFGLTVDVFDGAPLPPSSSYVPTGDIAVGTLNLGGDNTYVSGIPNFGGTAAMHADVSWASRQVTSASDAGILGYALSVYAPNTDGGPNLGSTSLIAGWADAGCYNIDLTTANASIAQQSDAGVAQRLGCRTAPSSVVTGYVNGTAGAPGATGTAATWTMLSLGFNNVDEDGGSYLNGGVGNVCVDSSQLFCSP
jgi:hypothetical protein